MIDDLKFVQGAVAKKDIMPSLTHFRIHDGHIMGYNGKIALCSPIQLSIDCHPKAIAFIKAIDTCKDTVQLSLTPAGRLSIKSGGFKAFIDCDPGTFPDIKPEGEMIKLNGELLKALKKLERLIGEDMSRAWCRGVLFRGTSAFATNNIILAEYWLGYTFPFDMNIPHDAVNELIRIGKEPVAIQMTPNSVTFHYEGNRWLRTQTYSTEWPDISKVLDKDTLPISVPPSFFDSLDDLTPFANKENRVYFLGDRLATEAAEGEGASQEVVGIPKEGCFNIKQLGLLSDLVESVDFQYLPKGPIMFFGENLRGAIVGMRT